MNTLLLNLDLITSDMYQDVSALLEYKDLAIYTFTEEEKKPSYRGNNISLEASTSLSMEDVSALIVIAPGINSIKMVLSLVQSKIESKKIDTDVLVYLPEFWLVDGFRDTAPFVFEAYYTYVSEMLSVGYPRMTLACASVATAEYYESNMLGGFTPKVASVKSIAESYGLSRHLPVGIG